MVVSEMREGIFSTRSGLVSNVNFLRDTMLQLEDLQERKDWLGEHSCPGFHVIHVSEEK